MEVEELVPPTAAALARLAAVLATEPDADGGPAVALATAGPPPAFALLSTGSVVLDGTTVRLALHASSSAVRRLGGTCALLLTDGDAALRASVSPAGARLAGPLAVIEGPLVELRASRERPWAPALRFDADSPQGTEPYLRWWRELRAWLTAGAHGAPPTPPAPAP